MAWRAEVIADASGKWCGNGLVFETEREAKQYVADLSMRWIMVRDTRVCETDAPVNYKIEDNKLIRLD